MDIRDTRHSKSKPLDKGVLYPDLQNAPNISDVQNKSFEVRQDEVEVGAGYVRLSGLFHYVSINNVQIKPWEGFHS